MLVEEASLLSTPWLFRVGFAGLTHSKLSHASFGESGDCQDALGVRAEAEARYAGVA